MEPSRPSRRSLLLTGGAAVGTGLVGGIAWPFYSDDDSRDPGGLTAGTVPAGSDPLAWIDVDEAGTAAETAAIATLVRSRAFDDVPETFRTEFDDEQSSSDANCLRELVLVGADAEDHGAAIVWADWSDERAKGLLDASHPENSETYNGYSLHTAGETSVVVLGDGVFTVGATPVVRNVVDVWNDDVGPIGGETLRRFEGTPRGNVRFSFDSLPLPCEGVTGNRSEAYGRVTQIAGGVPTSNTALRLELFADSQDAAADVASAVRSDLGLSSSENQAGSPIEGFPEFVTDAVTVVHEADFVRIECGGVDGESGEHVRKIIRFVSCVVDSSARRSA